MKEKVFGKVERFGNFTYCSCKGNKCNDEQKSEIKCYSTPLLANENSRNLYKTEYLNNDKFYNEINVVSCPIDITQCYRYGKSD